MASTTLTSGIVNNRISCRTLKTWALASTALVNFSLLSNCNALTNKYPLQPRGTSHTSPFSRSSTTPSFVPRSAGPPYYLHSRLKNLNSIRSLSSTTSTPPQNREDMACARTFQVVQVPCLSDNYGYLIHDEHTGHTAAIDTPCAKSYQKELNLRGWKLTHILNTHHHYDHTGGNEELKTKGGVTIVGPVNEKNKIPGIDVAVGGGDTVPFGQTEAKVIDVGGHTKGHIAYYFPTDQVLFSGDALFVMGCGRMFEGTAPQFWDSLERLRELPDDTTVYCAHEYTESNGRFALSVEPGNEALVRKMEMVRKLREVGNPTVPSMLGEEKKINPFLRVDVSDEIKKNVGAGKDEPAYSIFAKVRAAKDSFRG